MNVYEMIITICAWMRANPDSPIVHELKQCKTGFDMCDTFKTLVMDVAPE